MSPLYLFSQLQDAETGHRGYPLTGEAGSLAPSHAAIAKIANSLNEPASYVIVKINMPKINGIEATDEIKSRYSDIVVIGLSVHAGGAYKEAMRNAGAAMLLTKEGAVDELYRAIQETLGAKVMGEKRS